MSASGETSPGEQPPGMVATLGRILRLWRPHAAWGALLLVLLLVPKLYETFFAYSLRLLVDRVLPGSRADLLAAILGGLVLGFLLAAAASLAAEYLTARIGAVLLNTLRLRMFDHLLALPAAFFDRSRTGDLSARFSGDLADLEKGLTTRIVDFFYALVGLAINLPVLFVLEWRLATLTLAGLPVVALGTRLFAGRAGRARFQLKQVEAEVVDAVQETVRAEAVVRVFHVAPWVRRRFTDLLERVKERSISSQFLAKLVATSSSLGVLSVQVAVLAAGSWLCFRDELSLGSLVAFVGLHGIVSKDAYDLTKKVGPSLIQSSGSLLRIENLLGEPVGSGTPETAKPLATLEGRIDLEGISFAYADGSPVLEDLSVSIGAGESVAIVGPSGCGKSTLLRLLLRFHEPRQGRISIDGVPLNEIDGPTLRRVTGVVLQENPFFHLSILDNLTLGRSFDPREVEEACRAAEIHDFVASLAGGYETVVGEMGSRLSGGQRQRLAIARALLGDPPILVLDEATSALDPGTEAALNGTLERLGSQRTTISVTHRLTSARRADRILVLDRGRLVQAGSHDELVAREGRYRELWTRQQGVSVAEDLRSAEVTPEHLAAVGLFEGWQPEDLRRLASRFALERCRAGEVLCREGELGDRFYLVVRGRVEVSSEASPEPLSVLDDGCFFGEIALLEERPRVATVRALVATVLLTLDRRAFLRLLEEEPELERQVRRAASLRRSARAADDQR